MNICHHILTSSTQLQNRSFHVVKKTKTSMKCVKMARAMRERLLFSIDLCKFVTFLLPSSSVVVAEPP